MTDKRNEGTINMKEINQLNDTNSSLDGFRKEINEDQGPIIESFNMDTI